MTAVLASMALLLALLVVAGCVLLLLQIRAMRRTVSDLEGRVANLEPAPTISPDLATIFGSGRRRIITIEILNPIQIATSRVKVAAVLGAIRPALLTRVVYTQAVKEVSETLEAEGVVAEVKVHDAR